MYLKFLLNIMGRRNHPILPSPDAHAQRIEERRVERKLAVAGRPWRYPRARRI